MPRVEFEPTIPVFEGAKIFHVLDSTATVIGRVNIIFTFIHHTSCHHPVASIHSIYTVKPRFTNASDHEQIFRTQSVSDDVVCLELRTRKPSTSWSDKLGVSASAVFSEESSSGKYPESTTPIGESVGCCVAFVHSNSLCLL
jgi:hypothetical protein